MTAVEFLHSKYIKIFGELNPSTAQLYEIAYALEQAKVMEKEQRGYSEEDVREMLFMALNEPEQECCITHTKDSIVRKVLKTFKSE